VSSDDYSWKKESRFFHRPSSKTAKNGGIYILALNVRNSQRMGTLVPCTNKKCSIIKLTVLYFAFFSHVAQERITQGVEVEIVYFG
jgi:hypothetical protein